MTETKAQFAKRIGVHKSTITRAAHAGRLVMAGDRVLVAESLARWHATKGGRDDVAARHAVERGAAIPEAIPSHENGATAPVAPHATHRNPAEPEGNPDADPTRTDWKAAAIAADNALVRLEMDLRRGLRLPLAAVGQEAQGLGATLRAGIERIIDQVAPRLAVERDAIARRRILRDELRRLRRVIKREIPRGLRRIRASGGKVGAGATAKEGSA